MTQTFSGKLEVICGSMFSGKTEELMLRLRRAEYAKKNVMTIKHEIDNRKSYSCIVSHNGVERTAQPIEPCKDGLNTLKQCVDGAVDVVGIDEIQFFPDEIIPILLMMVESGKRVLVAGLDMDFRCEPFGIVPTLMSLADEVCKLRAICVVCGNDANFTQRLINGKPAKYDDPTILVGGQECYEARCRRCYRIDRKRDHTGHFIEEFAMS
ncbi:Thymidine kinase [Waddlia chondrophila 2032/99]|uniref:Thymidine kinase n=1 Tax=Waddlia chondrophila 2032/99 TaxID=765953 RepID=F8LD65_9BACT|nr:Thymidine kinase [Waddlia chondrophila 2032/99]